MRMLHNVGWYINVIVTRGDVFSEISCRTRCKTFCEFPCDAKNDTKRYILVKPSKQPMLTLPQPTHTSKSEPIKPFTGWN